MKIKNILAVLAMATLVLIPKVQVMAAEEDKQTSIREEIDAIIRSSEDGGISPYAATNKIANKCSVICETLENNPFQGKNITVIGDSISVQSWPERMGMISDSNITNLAIGGSAIADYWDETSIILRWQEIPSDSDVIIVMAGINDYFVCANGSGDFDKYAEDTWNLLSGIRNTYSADVYLVTTYKSDSDTWEQFGGSDITPYYDLQKEYCDQLGIKVIDIHDTSFMDSHDAMVKEEFIPDGVHPNDDGAWNLAYYIFSELIRE